MTEIENFPPLRVGHTSSKVTCVIVASGRGKRWECEGCSSHGVWSLYSDHEGNAVAHLRKAHVCPGTIEICGDRFFDRICTLPKNHQRDGEKWGFGHWGPDVRRLRKVLEHPVCELVSGVRIQAIKSWGDVVHEFALLQECAEAEGWDD